MTYARHFRLSVRGTLVGPTTEEFSTGLSVAPDVTLQDALDTWTSAIAQWWGATASHLWQGAHPVTLVAQDINPDGTVATSLTEDASGIGGGHDPAVVPSFLVVCCSFETGFRDIKGKPIRGRMFLPNNVFGFTGSEVDIDVPGTVATAGKNLIDLMTTPGGVLEALQPVVASQTAGGRNLPIIATSADQIYDSMRTRKNKLVPHRTTVTI